MTETCGCGGAGASRCGRRRVTDLQLLRDLAPDRLHPLASDVPALADHLQLLDDVTAMTAGHGAALASRGRYGPPTTVGGPLAQPDIALRYAPGVVATALCVARPDGVDPVHLTRPDPPTLDLFDAGGRRLHQARLASPEQRHRLDSLEPAPSLSRSTTRPTGANATRMTPVPARPGVDDQIDLVDAHLIDSGSARLRTLTAHEGDGARRVAPRALEQLLDGLAELGLRPTVGVTSGLLQSHTGPIEAVGHAGPTLRVRSGAAVLAVGASAQQRTWVTTAHGPHGPTSALELFDPEGRALVLLTLMGRHPVAAHRAWQELVAALD